MNSLVNSSFNRTYNPCGTRNALSDIKRLLTSRDCVGQSKACGYLIEVIQRYNINSVERIRMVEYLLDNDIVVFLCEATSNLNFSLFRLSLECIRLFWCERRFFIEEHAAHAMAAVLRSLAHYAATDTFDAVDFCLHFLCDLLNSINSQNTTSALSHQSAYSSEQLLACLNTLASRICGRHRTILCSALMLDALISYQPNELDLRGHVVIALLEVLNQWFDLLLGGMNHIVLVDESEDVGMFFVVLCQLGIDILRLTKVLEKDKRPTDFVEAILSDEQEINILKQCSVDMKNTIYKVITDVIVFVKDNQTRISTEEYCVCLKFLLNFLHENTRTEVLTNFCDTLVTNGYLTILPHNQVQRNDKIVRRVSTLILGEMLKVLAEKYLVVDEAGNKETCANTIHMGLVELQYGIEKPQSIGMQLQKNQPYSLLIYMYFYCQSSDNYEECTAPLLPHLVEHILQLPKTFKPPGYIIKALWLVFAMSSISNGLLDSLDERVDLERATDRLVAMLHPEPSTYYSHNPAILLWAFSSLRIPYNVRILVLSRWLQTENYLPEDLSKQTLVWELLLNILVQNKDNVIATNCMTALNLCMEDGDEFTRRDFASLTWSTLPGVLSQALIDCEGVLNTNICYLLDIATSQAPTELDQTVCLKIAVLITALFSKNNHDSVELESKSRYELACLKLCLLLLLVPYEENDNKVLLTFVSRPGFLPSVLSATNSADDKVACAALQLLTYVVHYFTKNNYQPKSVLQIQSEVIVKSLRRDGMNERGVSTLHLLYTILSSGVNTPLVLTQTIEVHPSGTQQCNALKALLFRVQSMLCCKDTETQSSIGWKALSSIFKHAIIYKNDPKLVAALSTQPWTFVLIRFQLTLNVSKEFLSFLRNWLSLLKITLIKNRETNKFVISKYSPIRKTLVMINKNLDGEEFGNTIPTVVKEILENCNNREEY